MPPSSPPEPDISEIVAPELTPKQAGTDALLRDDLQFSKNSAGVRHIQEDRLAFCLALGIDRKTIAKRLQVKTSWVSKHAQEKHVAEKVVLHRRDLVEKAKGRLVRALLEGVEKLQEIKDMKLPEDKKEHRAFLAATRQQYDAARFLVETGMEFVRSDHALQKIEEHFFGVKTPAAPLVQINQTAEQPSTDARAIEQVIRSLPEARQREFMASIRERRKAVEAPPIEVVAQ
jgi:hypothetical protein